MPPKKKIDTPPAKITKEPKEKVPRKRKPREKPVKPEKPKLKIPTVVKMKLPSIKSFLSPSQNPCESPSSVANKGNVSPLLSPAAKRKLDLANEVALAQLTKPSLEAKPPHTIEEPIKKKILKQKLQKPVIADTKAKKNVSTPPVTETPNVPKKRGRKKKLVEETVAEPTETQPSETQPSDTPAEVAVPRKKRIYVRKTPLIRKKNMELKSLEEDAPTNETSIRQADSTSTPAPKPAVKRQSLRRKATKNDDSTDKQFEAPTTPDTVTVKKKGKKNLIDSVSRIEQSESPSILDEARKTIQNDVAKDEASSESKKKDPCPIDSRKNSTCASECLSWTKDISSSSTTTCLTVGSNDFFRIDKKVPIIKLSHVQNQWKNVSGNKNNCDDSDAESRCSDSSSSSSSSSASSKRESSTHSVSRSLNLSTSSITPSKSNMTRRNSVQSDSTKDDDWEYALQKLSANLKKLDIEAIHWIGYQNRTIDTSIDILQNKIFKLLKSENDLLKHCENINKELGAKNDSHNKVQNVDENNQENNQIVGDPNSYTSRSEEDENFTTSRGKYVMFDQNCAEDDDPMKVTQVCENKSSDEDAFNPDKMSYVPYDQSYNDDDDALSLFAESITGIDSSRINSSANSICANPSEHEEYIPQPVPTAQVTNQVHYVPTKIADSEPAPNKSRTVCEKQNADSTSIHRENKQQQNNVQQNSIATSSAVIKEPRAATITMMSDRYKTIPGIKSTVFRSVCFFNLISNCKKIRCIFPHVQLEIPEVRSRLAKLSDDLFVQEYMLLRTWPDLRRRYGICYVNECIERKLTRILVEMVIDFTCKAKLDSVDDAAIKINVTERTLLYLNTADLSVCEDLLQYDFGKGVLLCDVLMQTLGETQNFSRFKAVFIKLTDFITGIGGRFQLKVASQILERVCILPCEEALAFAVLAIVKNTEPKIFEDSMMSKFEKQLSSLDLVLYGKLYMLREQADVQRSQNSNDSALISQDVDRLGLMNTDREERYTSPDTTKNDKTKPQEDIPQTVKLNRPIFNHIFQSANSSPSSDEEKRPSRSWRGGHNQNYMRHPDMRFNRMRPPLKRHSDQRNVAFGFMPPKFPRRSGQEFF